MYDLHLEHGVNGGGYTCLSLAALRGITTQTKEFFIDTFGRHFSQTKDNDSAGLVTIFRRFSWTRESEIGPVLLAHETECQLQILQSWSNPFDAVWSLETLAYNFGSIYLD